MGQTKTVELTEEDCVLIETWAQIAANESYNISSQGDETPTWNALLEKLDRGPIR